MAINTIKIIGSGRHEEALAGASLSPGHLVALASTGKVAKHASRAGIAERLFAVEDALQGRGVDTAYATDEIVSLYLAQPGDVVNAFLKAGTNYAKGDILTSAGDGTLENLSTATAALLTSTDGTAGAAADLPALKAEAEKIGDDVRLLAARAGLQVIGVLQEAIDLSAGGAVATRAPVRVL